MASEEPTSVDWTFAPTDGGTFVSIRNSGFSGERDQRVKEAIASTEVFALVLASAEAWLEQGLLLNLVGDRHPKGVRAG